MKNFPQRLKAARKMRGMSLQDLSDAMGNVISKQAISKYETGTAKPNSEMLNAMCNALNVRPDYFDRREAVAFQKISFRKLKKLPVKEQDRVIGLSADYLERYMELENIMGIRHDVSKLKEKYSINNQEDIEEAAIAVRKQWKLGDDPIYNVIELLEDMGIKVLEVDADDAFSGMSAWVEGKYPVIVINRNKHIPADRLRFTALHELGHLVLDLDEKNEKDQEQICHAFSGAMLIPKSRFLKELGEKRATIIQRELELIKKQYGISMAALIYRARQLGIISENYKIKYLKFLSGKGWKKFEPAIYAGEERSNKFDQILLRAYAEEIVSGSKAAALKNMRLAEFRKFVHAV